MSADEYTHIMMRNSAVPEIASLAREHLIIEDYWNDTSDNIQVMSERDADETKAINSKEKTAKPRLLCATAESAEIRNSASPALTYNRDGVFASSPIACFTKTDFMRRLSAFSENEDASHEAITADDLRTNVRRQESPPAALRRWVGRAN